MVVTREPEWDDVSREEMLALAEYEAGICDCGYHRTIADTDPNLELDLHVCPVCQGSARALRELAKLDEEQTKHMPEGHEPSDGRSVYLKPKGLPSVAEKAPGN